MCFTAPTFTTFITMVIGALLQTGPVISSAYTAVCVRGGLPYDSSALRGTVYAWTKKVSTFAQCRWPASAVSPSRPRTACT